MVGGLGLACVLRLEIGEFDRIQGDLDVFRDKPGKLLRYVSHEVMQAHGAAAALVIGDEDALAGVGGVEADLECVAGKDDGAAEGGAVPARCRHGFGAHAKRLGRVGMHDIDTEGDLDGRVVNREIANAEKMEVAGLCVVAGGKCLQHQGADRLRDLVGRQAELASPVGDDLADRDFGGAAGERQSSALAVIDGTQEQRGGFVDDDGAMEISRHCCCRRGRYADTRGEILQLEIAACVDLGDKIERVLALRQIGEQRQLVDLDLRKSRRKGDVEMGENIRNRDGLVLLQASPDKEIAWRKMRADVEGHTRKVKFGLKLDIAAGTVEKIDHELERDPACGNIDDAERRPGIRIGDVHVDIGQFRARRVEGDLQLGHPEFGKRVERAGQVVGQDEAAGQSGEGVN